METAPPRARTRRATLLLTRPSSLSANTSSAARRAHHPRCGEPLRRPATFSRRPAQPQERVACSVAVNVWQHGSTGRIRVAVSCDLPGLQSLHWGVVPWGPFGDNHWELPLPEVRPAGTRVHDKTAVQTPLLPAGGGEPGAWAPGRVVIECDAADAPRAINFVLHEPAKNVWTHTAAGKVFHVPLPPRSAALAAAAGAVAKRTGLQSLLSTLNSFIEQAEAAEADAEAGGERGGAEEAAEAEAAPAGGAAGWEETYSARETVRAAAETLARVGARVTRHHSGAGVRVRVESDLPVALLLHWGVVPRGARNDIWAVPDEALWPPGTHLYKKAAQDRAVQTPMAFVPAPLPEAPPPGAGLSASPLPPLAKPFSFIDLEVGPDPAALRFVLKEADGPAWFDDDGSDFQLPLPEPPAAPAAEGPPAALAAGVAALVMSDGMPAALGPNSPLSRRPEPPSGQSSPLGLGVSTPGGAAPRPSGLDWPKGCSGRRLSGEFGPSAAGIPSLITSDATPAASAAPPGRPGPSAAGDSGGSGSGS